MAKKVKPKKEKKTDVKTKIYICTHTDFQCPVDNPVYEILDSRKIFADDKMQNGLDQMFYSELASYRHVAENNELPDYIGFCQYRKYFGFMDDIPNIPALIEKHGCIATEPYIAKKSIFAQYAKCFYFGDLEIAKGIVAASCPDVYPTFKAMLEGKELYTGNMFIMKKEDFLELMKDLWKVLDIFVETIGTDILGRINEYQSLYLNKHGILHEPAHQYRIGGNIGERFVSAWIMHRFQNPKLYPINYTESRKPYKSLW